VEHLLESRVLVFPVPNFSQFLDGRTHPVLVLGPFVLIVDVLQDGDQHFLGSLLVVVQRVVATQMVS
jgi:hypothetical protein